MSSSLNTGNNYITYDLRLDSYIDEYEFDGEIVLNFTLPFLLPKINDAYCILTSEEYFVSDLFIKESRRVVFAGTRNWIDDQNISARHSTISISSQGNTVLTTSLTVAIEVKKKEFNAISSLIGRTDILENKLKDIMQDSLEIILVKYNECAEGKSFRTPSYFDCDRIHAQFFKNYFMQRLKVWEYVTPNDTSPDGMGIDESPILREEMEKDVLTWKYFLNKTNYHFLCKEYLDSIISAAIAVESYALNVVRSFCNNEDDEKSYTSEIVIGEMGQERISFLPMHKLYKKLKEDKHIYSSLSNTELTKCISKILNPRNDIMHGKRKVNFPLNEEAVNVNKYVNMLFKSIEVEEDDLEEHTALKIISCNETQMIYSTLSNMSIAEEEKVELVLRYIEKYPSNLILQYIYGKLVYMIGSIEEAVESWTNVIERCKNKSHVVIEICKFCYSQNNIDLSMDFLDKVPIEEQDERWNAFNAFLNFEKYLLNDDEKYIAKAIEQIELVRMKKPHYQVAYYIARDIAYKLNDILKARDFSRLLYKLNTKNYESMLFSAECNMLLSSEKECYNDFIIFLEIYKKNNYADYVVDFYRRSYNSDEIYSRALDIFIYLFQELQQDENKINILKEAYKGFKRIELVGEISHGKPIVFMPTDKNSSNFLVKANFPFLGTVGNVKDSFMGRYSV